MCVCVCVCNRNRVADAASFQAAKPAQNSEDSVLVNGRLQNCSATCKLSLELIALTRAHPAHAGERPAQPILISLDTG